MPSIPELERLLTDGRVELRDAAERDIPEILIAHQDDPALHERLGLRRSPTGADLGREMEEESGERAAGAGARLTILESGSDEFRGRVRVHHVDWGQARAELAVWVVPQARGRGLAAASLRLASRWLFDCGLQRIGILTEPGNRAMLATARSAGFVEEGLLRRYYLDSGGRRDMISFSLLPADLQDGAR
jgi:RimJ/RimL family protein N-acetyltransferase